MIQEEIYNELKQLKKPNESFTGVIRRLIRQQQNLSPFFGLLTDEQGEAIEQEIEKAKEHLDQADRARDDKL